MKLNVFDLFFIPTYGLMCVFLLYVSSSVLTFGGVLLILGAWFIYKGEVFIATFIYMVADVMWVINAYKYNDFQGMFFILVGMSLGIVATFKMQFGKMSKSLNR